MNRIYHFSLVCLTLSLLLSFTALPAQEELYPKNYWDEGCWTWNPCYTPDWTDCVYFSPKVFHEKLHTQTTNLSLLKFLGIDQGQHARGTLYGIDVGYIYKNSYGLWGQLGAQYAQGKLKDSTASNRRVYNTAVEGLVGYAFVNSCFTLTPFLGVGYSLNRQHFEELDKNDQKVRLRYHTYYIPFGLKLSYMFTPNFECSLHLQANPQADSTLKVNRLNQYRFELGKTTGYLVQVPLTWNITYTDYTWKILLVPFWNRLVYGKSHGIATATSTVYSSKQRYEDWGASITIGTLF